MYTQIAIDYLDNFAVKNIDEISKKLSDSVSLRDWDAEAFGKKDVVAFMVGLFSKVESINVKVLKTYEIDQTVLIEMEIVIDNDLLLVTDVIDFNEKNKIESIRAYLG